MLKKWRKSQVWIPSRAVTRKVNLCLRHAVYCGKNERPQNNSSNELEERRAQMNVFSNSCYSLLSFLLSLNVGRQK